MYATKNQKLIGIYRRMEDCPFCRKEKNTFQHILGVGDTQKPKFALVLINPTHLNISSKPDWKSYRFPFIGVRHFWKVLGRAGIVSSDLLGRIYQNVWSEELLKRINNELSAKRVYLTNLVKCTEAGPEYPPKERLAFGKSLLVEELRILKPMSVICFGLLTFKQLTGRVIKLSDYYRSRTMRAYSPSGHAELVSASSPKIDESKILNRVQDDSGAFLPSVNFNFPTRIFPCYFPAGRGSPVRAAEMLECYLR